MTAVTRDSDRYGRASLGAGVVNIADILTKGQVVTVFVKLMKILHNLSQESAALLVK